MSERLGERVFHCGNMQSSEFILLNRNWIASSKPDMNNNFWLSCVAMAIEISPYICTHILPTLWGSGANVRRAYQYIYACYTYWCTMYGQFNAHWHYIRMHMRSHCLCKFESNNFSFLHSLSLRRLTCKKNYEDEAVRILLIVLN